jgi:hypothetical protein
VHGLQQQDLDLQHMVGGGPTAFGAVGARQRTRRSRCDRGRRYWQDRLIGMSSVNLIIT